MADLKMAMVYSAVAADKAITSGIDREIKLWYTHNWSEKTATRWLGAVGTRPFGGHYRPGAEPELHPTYTPRHLDPRLSPWNPNRDHLLKLPTKTIPSGDRADRKPIMGYASARYFVGTTEHGKGGCINMTSASDNPCQCGFKEQTMHLPSPLPPYLTRTKSDPVMSTATYQRGGTPSSP